MKREDETRKRDASKEAWRRVAKWCGTVKWSISLEELRDDASEPLTRPSATLSPLARGEGTED
jgi:hypothetical protein